MDYTHTHTHIHLVAHLLFLHKFMSTKISQTAELGVLGYFVKKCVEPPKNILPHPQQEFVIKKCGNWLQSPPIGIFLQLTWNTIPIYQLLTIPIQRAVVKMVVLV